MINFTDTWRAFHMTYQRRILGVRWNDFVTNRAVADSTNLPSILSTIATRRHSFFGHIRRLSANTPARKALKLAVDSKSGDIPQHDWNRPAGRPRTTWMSRIVRNTGLTAADAWALANDRSTWRALRPTAGYAQQWVSELHDEANVKQSSSKRQASIEQLRAHVAHVYYECICLMFAWWLLDVSLIV